MSSKSHVLGVVDSFHEKNNKTVSEKKKFEEFQKQKSLGSSPTKLVPLNSSKYDGKGFTPSKIPKRTSPRSNSEEIGSSNSPSARPALVKANTVPISIPQSVASSIYGFPQVDDNMDAEEGDLDFSTIQPTSSELDDIEHSNAFLNAMDFEASASDISDNEQPSLLSPPPSTKKAPFTKKHALASGANDLTNLAIEEGECEHTPKTDTSDANEEFTPTAAADTEAEVDSNIGEVEGEEGEAEVSNDKIDPETATVPSASEVTMERRHDLDSSSDGLEEKPADSDDVNEEINADTINEVSAIDAEDTSTHDLSADHHNIEASIHDAESLYPASEITEAVATTLAAIESNIRQDGEHTTTAEEEEEPSDTLYDDYGKLTVDAVNLLPPDPATAFAVNVQRQSSRSSLVYSPSVHSQASELDQSDPQVMTSGGRREGADSVVTVESYKSDLEMLGIEKIDLNEEMTLAASSTADNVSVLTGNDIVVHSVGSSTSASVATNAAVVVSNGVRSAEKLPVKPNVKFSPTATVTAGIASTKQVVQTKSPASAATPTPARSISVAPTLTPPSISSTNNNAADKDKKTHKDLSRSYSCGKDDYGMGDIYQQASSPDSSTKRTPPSGANAKQRGGSSSAGRSGKSPNSGTSSNAVNGSSGGKRVDPNLTTITTITNTSQGSFQNSFTVKMKPNYDTFNSPIKHKINPLQQADAYVERSRPAVVIHAQHDPKAHFVFLFHAAVLRMQMAYSRQLFYRWKVKMLHSRQPQMDKRQPDYSPAENKRLRLATALSSRDGKGSGSSVEGVTERSDEEVEQYGNAHIRKCLDTIFRLFGKLENESSYQYNPNAAVPDETVNTATSYDPGLPLEDMDTSVISTDHDTSTIVTTTRKNNITTTVTTVRKLNYTRYDRMRGRVINCHSAKRGFYQWKKYVNGVNKIEFAIPPSLRLMLLCTQDQLWKMFTPFLPAKVGVPSDHLVEDPTTGQMVNTKYKKRLMDFESVWNLLREIKICPLLVGKARLADYFYGSIRDFHSVITAGASSPEKTSHSTTNSPSATTPVSRIVGQPTTPTAANSGLKTRHSSATTSAGATSSADKRSKSPNRTGAAASVNSSAKPGMRQSFVSPEGVKIRLTLFANEVTSVTGKEYAAPSTAAAANGNDLHGTKTPQRHQGHAKVTPATTFKEIDLHHLHSAISSSITGNGHNTTNGSQSTAPATLSLISFQKLLWRISVDCLMPPREVSTSSASSSRAAHNTAQTPAEYFTSLSYEEQQALLEWYLALMMGTKRGVINQEILKLLKNVSIYDEKKTLGAR